MIKQLIIATTSLLIHDALKAIQYTQPIHNLKMMAQYVLHDNKMLCYI